MIISFNKFDACCFTFLTFHWQMHNPINVYCAILSSTGLKPGIPDMIQSFVAINTVFPYYRIKYYVLILKYSIILTLKYYSTIEQSCKIRTFH